MRAFTSSTSSAVPELILDGSGDGFCRRMRPLWKWLCWVDLVLDSLLTFLPGGHKMNHQFSSASSSSRGGGGGGGGGRLCFTSGLREMMSSNL